jgi:hypothetical protein
MKANCCNGIGDLRVEDVPDPKILNPRDAIIKITSTAICGSDLHIYDGYIPSMMKGDILGHEFMGEVGGRSCRQQSESRRPSRQSIPDCLWPLLFLHDRTVLAVRKFQSERLDG